MNASRVATPVIARTTDTSTLTVDGVEYRIDEVFTSGQHPIWLYAVTNAVTGEPVYFTPLLRVFGPFAVLTELSDQLASPRALSTYNLAGLIAGAIAFHNASSTEWNNHN